VGKIGKRKRTASHPLAEWVFWSQPISGTNQEPAPKKGLRVDDGDDKKEKQPGSGR